jgi:single-strand DNA-binding protein
MRSVNKVVLIGNLTRDPVLKQTQNGQAVVTFGIATNREWMTAGSEKKQSTEFHEIVAWAKLAEICDKFLKKSKLVYLEGYLKTRSWEDESGEKRYRTEVVLRDMVILEKKDQGGGEEADKLLAASADAEDIAIAEEEGENMF